MKAVRFHQYGGPEVLQYEDVPDAKPRADQVLVRVRACALNHLDLWLRKGIGQVPLPHINGSDVAGEVAAVGEYITDLKPGQRVLLAPMVFCNHCDFCTSGVHNFCRQFSVLGNRVDGGNCELLAIPRVNVVPIPDSLSFEQAAALPLVLVTAWHMLVSRAKIQPGQTILVIGAGSGVGSIAIQIGKLFNCRVITTAGDERKMEKGRELGADFTINHYQQKISEEVRKDHQQGRRGHRPRARGQGGVGRMHEVAQDRRHAGDLRQHQRRRCWSGHPLPVLASVLASGVLHGNDGRSCTRA